jgi:AraC-like DNA-binding protein
MYIEIEPALIIDLFSFTTAIMLGLLFVVRPSQNRIANIFLGLMLWSLSVEVLGSLSDVLSKDGEIFFHSSLFTLPFLLFYIAFTINKKLPWQLYLLFLPGVLFQFLPIDLFATQVLEYVFNLGVLFSSLRIIYDHQKHLSQYYSNLENKTLQWIRLIIYVFIGFHALWILEDILSIFDQTIPMFFAMASTLFTFVLIFWIGYNGFSQPEIFSQRLFIINEDKEELQSVLNDNRSEQLAKVEQIILTEKLFCNPKLNLRMLAEACAMNEKELSALINQVADSNFYTYINRFRVNEYKLLLQSPKAKQLSQLGLAQESGFNSKSTFYAAFKSLEDCTPRQYELNLRQSE